MQARIEALRKAAPICARSTYMREGNCYYLCGTIGAEFDVWQRQVSAMSAADALFSQQIGLEAVEKVMDELETKIRAELGAGERLKPRFSPGYGEVPLEKSHEIIAKLDATRKIGVSLTDSLLLVPSKSVTAICEVVGC